MYVVMKRMPVEGHLISGEKQIFFFNWLDFIGCAIICTESRVIMHNWILACFL